MDNLTDNRNSPGADLTDCKPCASLCAMCNLCVFAKTPPISTDRLWTVGDSFQRKFLTDLLFRCRSPQVLEKLLHVLDLTSWSIFAYPISHDPDSADPGGRERLEKPRGFNGHAIREWFDSSPDWIRSHYLCSLLLRCDNDLLRTLANLTNVLLLRQQRGLLTFEGCNKNDEGPEEPAIMVVPGSSKSYSGISRFKDFISSLPVNLAKRILGFLDEPRLELCAKVSMRWQFLANATIREIEFRKRFHAKILEVVECHDSNIVSPTYANVVKVEVPVSGKASCDKQGNLKTELVKMEERNVFCGAFFTTDVIDKCDPHRVIDYRGTTLMAAGSRDGAVHLLDVTFDAKVPSVLKGNMVQIRALQLCEDKDLVITGSFDAIIRCWNLKSMLCVKTLSGHTNVVNCLDVCGDRLVSGSKDCTVKIWSLQLGKLYEEYNFMHPGSVRCVKIHRNRVYSSCNKGQVKIWDLKKAEVLKVIAAHQSSVRCLFFNQWHLLTGDIKGVVMAWSTHRDAKDCLKTFNHPNFIVNTSARVTCFNFGEVFWDNADSTNKDKIHVQTEEGLISDKTNPPASAPANKVSSRDGTTHNRRKSLPSLISSIPKRSTEEQRDSDKVVMSEMATSARIKKRGPHHQPTRDYMFLKMNATQKAIRMDEVGVNMEYNAKLRDDWRAPKPSDDPTPAATNTAISKCDPKRQVSTAPGRITRPHPPLVDKTASQSAKTERPVNKSATNNVSKEQPKNLLAQSISDLDSFVKSTKKLKGANSFNNQMEFNLLPTTQLDEHTKSQKDLKAKKKVMLKKKGL